MNDVFRAYDVRGIAGQTLTADTVKRIAWAFGRSRHALLLGHDIRVSSPEFYAAAYSGLIASGVSVKTVGLITTPMITMLINTHHADGGIMITASHNPVEYNGMKFYGPEAVPIGIDSGLLDVKTLVPSAPDIPNATPAEPKGALADYADLLLNKFRDLTTDQRRLRIAIDNGNGTAALALERLLPSLPWLEVEKIFWEPDGMFPGRGPNPLIPGALSRLRELVPSRNLDLGVAFDADEDRVFFVDERGDVIRSDIIIAWLADRFLDMERGGTIVVPVGISRIVEDVVRTKHGTIALAKTGFVSMRRTLREERAIFGGERAGHFYFRDFFFADSGIWTFLIVLRILCRTTQSLSQILAPYKKYHSTGEVNFEVQNSEAVIDAIKRSYVSRAKSINELDGFFADFGEWWMLVRPSNTEPLLRVVIESNATETLKKASAEVFALVERNR